MLFIGVKEPHAIKENGYSEKNTDVHKIEITRAESVGNQIAKTECGPHCHDY